jgi:hypothetical protein
MFKPLQELLSVENYARTFGRLLKFFLTSGTDADASEIIRQSRNKFASDLEALQNSAPDTSKLDDIAATSLVDYAFAKFCDIRQDLNAVDHWQYATICSLAISKSTFANPRGIARLSSKIIYFIRSVLLMKFSKDVSAMTKEQ